MTNCKFDGTCKWKMFARKDRGVAGENPTWVLDTRTDKVQWTYAASAHGRFGPSALFHARHLRFQVFALETADGKFLGYDDNTGRITVDQEVQHRYHANCAVSITFLLFHLYL